MSVNRDSDLQFIELSVYGSEEDSASRRLVSLTLRLSSGEWLNVVGTNGSGKSTLAKLLANLSRERATGRFNRGFAGTGTAPYVMQHPDAQLFGSTPREELVFALEWSGMPADRIPEAADRMLANMGLSEFAHETWEHLSGGQRQLAAVAAATAGDASLYVFDEATSMLDEASRRRVRAHAAALHNQGAAIVWVTQRLDELAPESRVVALADGQLVYDGTGRTFLYGPEEQKPERSQSACLACGLRLPYMAELALELFKQGKLQPPLPMSADEWASWDRRLDTQIGIPGLNAE